jgi:hypothetical protein
MSYNLWDFISIEGCYGSELMIWIDYGEDLWVYNI